MEKVIVALIALTFIPLDAHTLDPRTQYRVRSMQIREACIDNPHRALKESFERTETGWYINSRMDDWLADRDCFPGDAHLNWLEKKVEADFND